MTYKGNLTSLELVQECFKRWICRYQRKAQFKTIEGMRNRFENRLVCYFGKDEVACVAWGGNSGWVHLEIRGQLCRRMEPRDWLFFRWLAGRLEARIKRVDIAFDTFDGRVDMDEIPKLYQKDPGELMNYRGKPPLLEPKGCYELGRSWYISQGGHAKSKKYICVYEKGMQIAGRRLDPGDRLEDQQAAEARKWVRIELRLLHEKKRFEIPPDVLDPHRWCGFVAGFGPYFKRLVPASEEMRFKTIRQSRYVEFCLKIRRKVFWYRKQAGKFNYFLGQLLGPELAWRMLSDETEEWSALAAFPNWKDDPDFQELMHNVGMGIVPYTCGFWNDAQDKMLYECRRWFDRFEGSNSLDIEEGA